MRPKKKVKLEDIAREVGVSVVTVSNALAGRSGVSDLMREKIQETAERLGYSFEKRSEAEPSVIHHAVILAPKVISLKNKQLIQALESVSRQEEMMFTLASGTEEYHRLRRSQKVEGVIVLEGSRIEDLKRELEYGEIPMVACGFFDSHLPIDYVFDDGFHSVRALVRKLYTEGRTKICFAASEKHPDTVDRFLGYQFGLCEITGSLSELYEKTEEIEDQTVERAVQRALLGEADGIVCGDTKTALLVKEKLGEETNCLVTGYHFSWERELYRNIPALVTDGEYLAKKTIRILQKRIEHKGKESGACPLVSQYVDPFDMRKEEKQ